MSAETAQSRSKIITVTSLKGGVGKSTVTANLAYALALRGKRTLAVDCDLNIRNLDLIMGLENSVVYDLSDAVRGTVPIEKAVLSDSRSENLFLCAAPYSGFGTPDRDKFREVIGGYAESGLYDYIIIDTPGDSGKILELSAGCSDIVLIITTHQPASLRAAERTGELVRSFGVQQTYLIINSFSSDEIQLGYRPGILSMIDRSGVSLLGIIPYDEHIQRFQEDGILIAQTELRQCRAAFDNIVRRLCGEDVPLFDGFPRSARRRSRDVL